MSLFSSPAFAVFNSENSESMVQRKPGGNTLLPRKPFVDKTVNCNTPDVNRKRKSNLTIKEPTKAASPIINTPNLELNSEDYFSYKEMEDRYEDVYYFKHLEQHHVYSIVKNYLDDSTPPPSPPQPVNMPFDDIQMPCNSLESSFNSNKSCDEDIMFFSLPKNDDFMINADDQIDLPVFNIDDL